MKHRTNKLLASLAFSACSLFAIGSPAIAATVNVDQNNPGCGGAGMPYCTIGAAVNAAAPGDTVSVAPGTYVENVLVSKNLAIVSTGGRGVTTIRGVSNVGALGAVQISGATTVVEIAGFKVEGIDNGSAAIENAAVYVSGNHASVTVRDNELVAMGEAGLLSEFGAAVSGFLVDGNVFSGQTFPGSEPGGCGFGNQFTDPTVPRQLVTLGGGAGTTNVVFTNNQLTGTAGGSKPACVPTPASPNETGYQGNTLATIDAVGSTISGNSFNGTTGRFATSLRARRSGTTISGNSFSGAGLLPAACHVFVQNGSTLGDIASQNTFDTLIASLPDGAATLGSICPVPDADNDGVADADDLCPATLPGEAVNAVGCSKSQVVEGVKADVQSLTGGACSADKPKDRLQKAQRQLEGALAELARGDVEKALKKLSDAVHEMEKAQIECAGVAAPIAELVELARATAQAGIDAAVDPKQIAKAQKEMAKAQESLAKGESSKAIDSYAKAFKASAED